ncbi:hypothetical protein [Deinococcus marmoris]|uniref:Uncharacterized protein n=1 Tax=Deinococcus marmoris TaxID=249408 RepID=A0A1U7P3W3_9DEIO|nr:hypothetical protein [Deinococcus marmoris]OLV19854.1 hypothetical protein BOO71_0001258 [Deinococcus marmoris]
MTPIPIPSPSSPPGRSRAQRVGALASKMGLIGGILAALAAVMIAIGQSGESDVLSFVKGMGFGILSALPFFFAVYTVRAVLLMDEYVRALQMQATSIAFMVTMVVAGGLIALEAAFKFQTPSYVFYAVGMLSWMIALAVLNRRSRQE